MVMICSAGAGNLQQPRSSSLSGPVRARASNAERESVLTPGSVRARSSTANPSRSLHSNQLVTLAEQAALSSASLQGRRQEPPVDPAALAQLREIFPAWDEASIRDVLASAGGSVETAVMTLSEWTTESDPTPAAGSSHPATGSRCVRPTLEPVSPWHEEREKVRCGLAVHKAFSVFDKNGDGSISRDELTAVIQAMHPETSSAELQEIFEAVDKNGDGVIQLEEFMSWLWDGVFIAKTDNAPVALPRADYDRIIAARLSRRCSSRCLAGVLKAKTVWKQMWLAHRVVSQHLPESGTAVGLPDIGVFLDFAGNVDSTAKQRRSLVQEERALQDELKDLSREDAIVAGKELLRQRCKFLGMQPIEMKDDGNCQFRAISQELYGTQEYHLAVRCNVVNYLRNNANEFSVFFEAHEWAEYLRAMDRSKTWGDEMTLRASAESLKIRIHIVSSVDENWYLSYEPSDGVPDGSREVFLTYIAPIHYNTLAPLR